MVSLKSLNSGLTFTLGKMPKKIQIRKKAQSFGKKGAFKGSKGWCDKFVVRNKEKIKLWIELSKYGTIQRVKKMLSKKKPT